MANAILCTVLILGATDGVRVEMLDGPAVVGVIESIRADGVVVATRDGDVSIPADRLLRVQRTATDTAEHERTSPWIELRDGSILPVAAFTVDNRLASFTIPGGMGQRTVTVPIAQVVAVRLKPSTPKIDDQWQSLRAATPVADVLVIRRKEAVDYVEGVLGNIDAAHVTFAMDEESVPVPRSKVDGLLYYRSESSIRKRPLCTVFTLGGMQLAAARIELADVDLLVSTLGGLDISLPLSRVTQIDYSAGKLVYLTDLKHRIGKSIPLVGLPPNAELAHRAEGPVFNRGFFSGQPMLRLPKKERQRTTWEIVSYDRGIGMRSRTELSYRLPRGFRRLRALAGIDAELGDRGSVRVMISSDGEALFDQVVDGSRGLVPVDLEIVGVRQLSILVDYGPGGDVGDRLYLCNPRILK